MMSGSGSSTRARLAACSVLMLGTAACQPKPTTPSSTSPATTDAATTDPAPPSAAAPADEDGPPPDESIPKTCSITVQLLEPGGVTGRGSSSKDSAAAKDTAWADACAQLRKSHDLDCHDKERIAIRSQRSTTINVQHGSGSSKPHYKYTLELTTQRQATGFSDAPAGREQACAQAKAQACEQLVGGPCPADDIRVIAVDGRAPNAAAVEPEAPEDSSTPDAI